jgi:hypothetical protein
LRRAVAAGSVPLVSWNDGPDNAGVAAGNEDRRIRATARMLRGLEAGVFFRFGWEMDADGTTGTGSIGPPEDWIAAYRRIHRLIREEAGDRVEFVWCPTVWGFRPGSDRDPADWYPGDDVVDWICADGYNWSDGGDDWESFDEVYRHFFRWARDVDKPIMIGEVGTMEDPGDPDRKARWITEMGWSIKCRHRDVGAVVWFDTDRRRPGEPPRNWRLASSPRSLAAAGDLAADRWFGGPEDTIDCDEPPDGS